MQNAEFMTWARCALPAVLFAARRRRARLLGLLPAWALLLGALSLLPAAPAQAQTTLAAPSGIDVIRDRTRGGHAARDVGAGVGGDRLRGRVAPCERRLRGRERHRHRRDEGHVERCVLHHRADERHGLRVPCAGEEHQCGRVVGLAWRHAGDRPPPSSGRGRSTPVRTWAASPSGASAPPKYYPRTPLRSAAPSSQSHSYITRN